MMCVRDTAFPGVGVESIDRKKGIPVVAPYPVTEGTLAVSQLCGRSRASGGVFFCAP